MPTVAASSHTLSVYRLVPTARLSDFWNFAVAIVYIVLVILWMFRTALRRFTIARAVAMGQGTHPIPRRCKLLDGRPRFRISLPTAMGARG